MVILAPVEQGRIVVTLEFDLCSTSRHSERFGSDAGYSSRRSTHSLSGPRTPSADIVTSPSNRHVACWESEPNRIGMAIDRSSAVTWSASSRSTVSSRTVRRPGGAVRGPGPGDPGRRLRRCLEPELPSVLCRPRRYAPQLPGQSSPTVPMEPDTPYALGGTYSSRPCRSRDGRTTRRCAMRSLCDHGFADDWHLVVGALVQAADDSATTTVATTA